MDLGRGILSHLSVNVKEWSSGASTLQTRGCAGCDSILSPVTNTHPLDFVKESTNPAPRPSPHGPVSPHRPGKKGAAELRPVAWTVGIPGTNRLRHAARPPPGARRSAARRTARRLAPKVGDFALKLPEQVALPLFRKPRRFDGLLDQPLDVRARESQVAVQCQVLFRQG